MQDQWKKQFSQEETGRTENKDAPIKLKQRMRRKQKMEDYLETRIEINGKETEFLIETVLSITILQKSST